MRKIRLNYINHFIVWVSSASFTLFSIGRSNKSFEEWTRIIFV